MRRSVVFERSRRIICAVESVEQAVEPLDFAPQQFQFLLLSNHDVVHLPNVSLQVRHRFLHLYELHGKCCQLRRSFRL